VPSVRTSNTIAFCICGSSSSVELPFSKRHVIVASPLAMSREKRLGPARPRVDSTGSPLISTVSVPAAPSIT
jgi:hypothetical protein